MPARPLRGDFRLRSCAARAVDNRRSRRAVYTRLARPLGQSFLAVSLSLDEADLSAKRAPAEAQAWLPCPHVDPRRPRDPQAPPREGPQAALRLSRRLDRAAPPPSRPARATSTPSTASGRSVSTRFLVLYWFARDEDAAEPRLGLAVPKSTGGAVVRNRIKRQLREAWRALLDAGAARPRLRARRAARPARGRPSARLRLAAASASSRCSEKAAALRYRRHRARLRRTATRSALLFPTTLQVPPVLLAVRARRAAQLRARAGLGARRLAAAPLQPLEPPAASTARDQRCSAARRSRRPHEPPRPRHAR